jgi:hypothetical protein
MVRATLAILFTLNITCERPKEEIRNLQEARHPQDFGIVLQESCVMRPGNFRNTPAFPVHSG